MDTSSTTKFTEMALPTDLKQTARTSAARPGPRVLTVQKAWRLTPNMIRVIFAGPELEGFPEGSEGGNCKIMMPGFGESRKHFAKRLTEGTPPVRRTYTVRSFNSKRQELAIDFVAHGDDGPASRWATHTVPGDFLGFAGPSAPKVVHFNADWYLIAADPSAIPMAAATLEAMPRDAKGVAVFEITEEQDRQDIDAPKGVPLHWLVHSNPQTHSTAQETFIRAFDWPEGRVQTCIAGESSAIRNLRKILNQEKKLPRSDTYISGYWKIGFVEDEHQKLKKADN